MQKLFIVKQTLLMFWQYAIGYLLLDAFWNAKWIHTKTDHTKHIYSGTANAKKFLEETCAKTLIIINLIRLRPQESLFTVHSELIKDKKCNGKGRLNEMSLAR